MTAALPAPSVSVVMTVHNAEPYLAAAVESIRRQSVRDIEFIIIDDGSTDGGRGFLERIADRDRRVRLIRNETALRPAAAANIGLSLAQGRYIARMDADDITHPDRLALQVRHLDAHPDHAFVGCAFDTIDAEGRRRKRTVESTQGWECAWTGLFRMPVAHPGVMIRGETLRVHALRYDPAYDGAEDFELFTRLMAHADGSALPQVLLQYRVHGRNVSVTRREQLRASARRAAEHAWAERFPDLAPEARRALGAALFDSDAAPDHHLAFSALEHMEAAFAAARGLDRPAREVLRTLAIRWMVQGAIRRATPGDPSRLASFFWSARRYAPAMIREALAYTGRRTTVLAVGEAAA